MTLLEIVLLLGGFYMVFVLPVQICLQWRRDLVRKAHTAGVVVGHQEREGVPNGFCSTLTYHARIRYTVRGNDYECVSSLGASWKIHRLQQRVTVAYNPKDPNNADAITLKTHPIFMYATCAVAMVGGIILLWFILKM